MTMQSHSICFGLNCIVYDVIWTCFFIAYCFKTVFVANWGSLNKRKLILKQDHVTQTQSVSRDARVCFLKTCEQQCF